MFFKTMFDTSKYASKNWIYILKNIILLFYISILCSFFIAKHLEKNITKEDITHLGTGMQLLHNIEIGNAEKRFAIVNPPLAGIILALPLYLEGFHFKKSFIDINTIDKYDDMVSYLYAKSLPYQAGMSLISQMNEGDLKNLICNINFICVCITLLLVSILMAYLTESVWISIGTIIFFANLNVSHYILSSFTNNILMIFLLFSLLLIMEMLQNPTYLKACTLGIVMGGIYATAGNSGTLIFALLLLGCIISRDILRKRVSKGFNKKWVGYIASIVLVFLLSIWICYGMYLTSPDPIITAGIFQIVSLICEGVGCDVSNVRIIPFGDILRQFIFSIIFDTKTMQQNTCHIFGREFNCQSIVAKCEVTRSVMPLFLQYILLLSIISLFAYKQLKTSKIYSTFFRDEIVEQFTLSILTLLPIYYLSIFLYIDPNAEKTELFITNIVILMILSSLMLSGILVRILMTIFNINRNKILN